MVFSEPMLFVRVICRSVSDKIKWARLIAYWLHHSLHSTAPLDQFCCQTNSEGFLWLSTKITCTVVSLVGPTILPPQTQTRHTVNIICYDVLAIGTPISPMWVNNNGTSKNAVPPNYFTLYALTEWYIISNRSTMIIWPWKSRCWSNWASSSQKVYLITSDNLAITYYYLIGVNIKTQC